ncbi:unnamed protein product [Prorocentrum cordatum]|uniref:C2H2-type domain-containing protein n=1 Tax=Prorocentrum cordatum TaxID=2364126 RepID=A0ABN9VA22_9DINO|nr:unnamed protein product [Polarella glacialis]
MLVGVSPFFDEYPCLIFRKVLAGHVHFPPSVGARARDLVRQFLTFEPELRLGNRPAGAEPLSAGDDGAMPALPEGLAWPELHPFETPSATSYDRWRLDEGDRSFAAIPVAQRGGGVLLAIPNTIPSPFLSAAELAAAGADGGGFFGLLGPYLVLDVPLLGAASRALATTSSVLVVDLDVNELELESLTPLPGPTLPVDVAPFAAVRGRDYWPRQSIVRLLREQCAALHGEAQVPRRGAPQLFEGEAARLGTSLRDLQSFATPTRAPPAPQRMQVAANKASASSVRKWRDGLADCGLNEGQRSVVGKVAHRVLAQESPGGGKKAFWRTAGGEAEEITAEEEIIDATFVDDECTALATASQLLDRAIQTLLEVMCWLFRSCAEVIESALGRAECVLRCKGKNASAHWEQRGHDDGAHVTSKHDAAIKLPIAQNAAAGVAVEDAQRDTLQKLSSQCSELGGGPCESARQWLDLICSPDQRWHNIVDSIHFAGSKCDSCAAPQGVQLHFACDLCLGINRRAFATSLGLAQHQRAVHGARNEAGRYVKADGSLDREDRALCQ